MKKLIRILNICAALATSLVAFQTCTQNGKKIRSKRKEALKRHAAKKRFSRVKPKRLSKRKRALERARLKKEILLREKERLKKLIPQLQKRRKRMIQERKKKEAARAREMAMRKLMQQRVVPKIVKKPVVQPQAAPSREAVLQAFRAGRTSINIGGREINFASGANQIAFMRVIGETTPQALFGLNVEEFNKKSKDRQREEIIGAYTKIMVPWRNPDRYPPQSREFVRSVSLAVHRSMISGGWIKAQ